MLPTINVGPLTLPTAGLVYIFGIWAALSAIERAAARLRLHVPATYSVAVTAIAAAFVGARLTFVVLHWSAYVQQPLGIIWPLTGGFQAEGGLLIGAAAAFFYGRARNLPPARTLDALTPGLLIGLVTVSLADFLAGPGYGLAADLPWSITLFDIRRHPVQLYEIAIALLAGIAWWLSVRRHVSPGKPFLAALAIYSGGRLFVDAYRANTPLTPGGYHILQLISLFLLLASLFLLSRLSTEEAPKVEKTGRLAPDPGDQ